jgi:hypothetical protein
MAKPRGFVFYDGPSALDGAPIIGIAVLRSANVKTGDMVQTFILRADQSPLAAIDTGADASICGDCVHRGADGAPRTCYVDVAKSVQSVYAAWTRGAYPLMSPAQGARMLAGRAVRLGAYGDPAAIPARHWRALLRFASGHTGYSHQWRQAHAQGLRGLVMASADSAQERDTARAMGWRTFRVRGADEPMGAREFACPASAEAGARRQCVDCQACDGAARGPAQASVAIIVHGRMARHFVTA